MTANAKLIHDAFDSLLARGYSLAVESAVGMAGTVAYRCPRLWLSFEWDRSNPWLTFTFSTIGPTPVMWTKVDYLVTGREHPEFGPNTLPEAPIPILAAFVDEVLPELDARVQTGDAAFLSKIRELESADRRELADLRAARRFR